MSKDRQGTVDTLTKKHYFKLKCTGPMSYHLGCVFGRDRHETLQFDPRKYVEKIEEFYHSIFGSKPKQLCMPQLEKGDHPELDTSKCLYQD